MRSNERKGYNPEPPFKRHENNAYTLHNLRREIRKYKKRHSRHIQIALAAERRGERPNWRTMQAIENNAEKVAQLEKQLSEITILEPAGL